MTSSSWPGPGTRYVAAALLWSLTLFAVLRVGWVQRELVLPFTLAQGAIATPFGGDSAKRVSVGLSCSGSDAIALCLGAILAYPVAWRKRLLGGAASIAIILILNVARIATLMRASARPALFDALHVYVWPALLTVAIAAWVFYWMQRSDRVATGADAGAPERERPRHLGTTRDSFALRFLVLTGLFVLVFVAASNLYLTSANVLVVAGWVAEVGSALMRAVGQDATVQRNMVSTARGSFVVTQECISTPLIPVYFAAIASIPMALGRRLLLAVAAAPIIFSLGVLRLLVLALPPALVPSTTFMVHAFNQLLVGVLAIAVVAYWQRRATGTRLQRTRHAVTALAVAAVAAFGAAAWGGVAERVASSLGTRVHGVGSEWVIGFDSQGALQMLPAYQIGLFLGIWFAAFAARRPTPMLVGLLLLALVQVGILFGAGELTHHLEQTMHARDIRGLALGVPLILAWLLGRRPHDGPVPTAPTTAMPESSPHG